MKPTSSTPTTALRALSSATLLASLCLAPATAAAAHEPATRPKTSDTPGRGRERILLVVDGGGAPGLASRVIAAFTDHGFVQPTRVVMAFDSSNESLDSAATTVDSLAEKIAPKDLLVLAVVLEGPGRTNAADRVATRLGKTPAIARVLVSRSCAGAPSVGVAKADGVLRVSLGGACASETDPMRAFLLGQGGAADVDDDHFVTAAEAVQFVADEAQANGSPFATTIDASPAELGIVLGHDASFPDSAELVLPRSGSPTARYRMYVQGENEPFAVVHARVDRDVRVRVPATRLVVHVLSAQGSRGLDLRIGPAEVNHIGPTEGRAMDRDLLDRDRGTLTKAINELSVAYGGGLGGYATFAHGAALRYSYAHPTYALSIAGTVALGGTSNSENENLYTLFGARVRAERRFFTGVPLVAVGAGFVGELALQSLHRTDSTALAGTGYAVIERYRAGAFGPELFANLRTTVGGTSFFGAELAAVFPFAPTGPSLQAYPRLEGSLYAGLCF